MMHSFKIPHLLIISIFLLASSLRADESPQMRDFALGRSINISGGSPIYSFELLQDVYQTVVSPSLSDIRVFDSKGTLVPLELSRVEPVITDNTQSQDVPFFPILGNETTSKENAQIQLSEDAQGKILSVHLGTDTTVGATTTSSYLVDLRNFPHEVVALQFQWSGQDNKVVPLSIESSPDLRSWRKVASGALARLSYSERQLIQARVECRLNEKGFIRVSSPGESQLSIDGVKAEYLQTNITAPQKTLSLSSLEKSKDGKSFFYDTQGFFPIYSVGVAFSEANMMADVVISSRSTSDSEWIKRLSESFYRLTIDGNSLDTNFKDLPFSNTDRYWKIETNGEALLASPPTLNLRYRPHKILFMAQGVPPYVLSYGSANVALQAPPFKRIPSLRGIPPGQASLGDSFIVGGTSRLHKETPPAPIPWKKWLLWCVLGAVLIFVLNMTRHLVKELKETPDK